MTCDTLGAVDGGQFRRAMRDVAAMVSVVTTVCDGDRYGMTASSVTGLSDEPPSLLACIKRSASSHDALLLGRAFAVNVLTSRHSRVARDFAQGPVNQRFAGGNWRAGPQGLPVLDDDGLVFCCALERSIPVFSHTIIIGTIFEILGTCWQNLLYRDGAFATYKPLE